MVVPGDYDYSTPEYKRRCTARKELAKKLRAKGIVEDSSKWNTLMSRASRKGYRR